MESDTNILLVLRRIRRGALAVSLAASIIDTILTVRALRDTE